MQCLHVEVQNCALAEAGLQGVNAHHAQSKSSAHYGSLFNFLRARAATCLRI